MLTHADARWRVLTYADVCWRKPAGLPVLECVLRDTHHDAHIRSSCWRRLAGLLSTPVSVGKRDFPFRYGAGAPAPYGLTSYPLPATVWTWPTSPCVSDAHQSLIRYRYGPVYGTEPSRFPLTDQMTRFYNSPALHSHSSLRSAFVSIVSCLKGSLGSFFQKVKFGDFDTLDTKTAGESIILLRETMSRPKHETLYDVIWCPICKKQTPLNYKFEALNLFRRKGLKTRHVGVTSVLAGKTCLSRLS